MNDDSLVDAQLQAFAAGLAAQAPQVLPFEKDELIYACAFAAGKSTAARSLRNWRVITAVMCFALAFTTTLHLQGLAENIQQQLANHPREQPLPPVPVQPPQRESTKPITLAQKPSIANLDAWQVTTSTTDALGEQIAQWQQTEPRLRSLAVGALTHSMLNH